MSYKKKGNSFGFQLKRTNNESFSDVTTLHRSAHSECYLLTDHYWEPKKRQMSRVIPASWHQTGTFQRGRRSSHSASAAEIQCSCLEDSQAAGPHEPSAVPYRPSQNLLHRSQPGTEQHFNFFWDNFSKS